MFRYALLSLFFLFIILSIPGCDYLELDTKEEILLGDQIAMEVESYYDLYRDEHTVMKVERIGKEMSRFTTRPFIYRFRVLDSDEINAFALPGGYVYIFKGLLDMGLNDDQIAAIIGHEITHIEADHFAELYERMKKKELFFNLAVLVAGGRVYNALRVISYLDAFLFEPKYSRENENECDIVSVQMMIQGGRNPQEFSELFKMWEREHLDSSWMPDWMKSHPNFITRIKNIEEEISLQHKLITPKITFIKKTIPKEEIDNFEDSFDFVFDDDSLYITWNNPSMDIKRIECYGLNEDQKISAGEPEKISPVCVKLDNSPTIKYIMAGVEYGNNDFRWDIIRVK